MLVNEDLYDYYKVNVWLTEQNLTLTEIENMSPMDRTIYTKLIINRLEKKANEN